MIDIFCAFIVKNPIDFLSLFISLLAFFYTFKNNCSNVKCKYKFIQNDYHIVQSNSMYEFFFDFVIHNRSKDPITITNIRLNNIDAFPEKQLMKGWGIQRNNKMISHDIFSIPFPLRLESFSSFSGMLLFVYSENVKLHKINLLRIYTSRGVIFKLVLIKHKNLLSKKKI